MFKLAKITGSGSSQTLLTMPSISEGNMHSVNIHNTTGSNQVVVFTVGTKSFTYEVSDVNTTIDMTINVPNDTTVSVNAPAGVDVVASYIEQAIDASGALTTAQETIALLPDGTINDSITTTTSTWSSEKIDTELDTKLNSTNPELTGNIYQNGSVRSNSINVSALNIDCSLGNYFKKTINGNSEFTFSNVPAGSYAFTLELVHTSGAVTWPLSVNWPSNEAPTLTEGDTHLFVLVTSDEGVTWRGGALADYVG